MAPVATSTARSANAAAAAIALPPYTQADGRRDDVEAGGRRADLLAVELDRQVLGSVDGDRRRAEQLDLRVREVRALVDLRRRGHEVALGDVADDDHVEEAVVRPCV